MTESIRNQISRLEGDVLTSIIGEQPVDFNVVLSNGNTLWTVNNPRFTFVFNDPLIVFKLIFFRDDYIVGKAFVEKEIDVEGDIIAATGLKNYLVGVKPNAWIKLRILYLCYRLYSLNVYLTLYELINKLSTQQRSLGKD